MILENMRRRLGSDYRAEAMRVDNDFSRSADEQAACSILLQHIHTRGFARSLRKTPLS